MCGLSRLRTKFDALCTEVYATADRAGLHRTHRLRTLGQYVGAVTNAPAAQASAAVGLSNWLRDDPVLAVGYTAGEITTRHIHYLRTKLDTNYHNHLELKADQEFFVDTARDTTWRSQPPPRPHQTTTDDPDR